LAKPRDEHATILASHASDEFGYAILQRSNRLLSLQATRLASPGSDGFGWVSGYRDSEINEIVCAVSVLAMQSLWCEPGEIEDRSGKKPELLGRSHGMSP